MLKHDIETEIVVEDTGLIREDVTKIKSNQIKLNQIKAKLSV